MNVRPLADSERQWLTDRLVERWGGTTMISLSTHQVERLPVVVVEQDEILGYCAYEAAGPHLEVVVIEALEKHRGAGTALLERMLEIARLETCSRVWLVTTNDNVDALRFYQRRGFRLAALHIGAADAGRLVKPTIPEVGEYGIRIHDLVELEQLVGDTP